MPLVTCERLKQLLSKACWSIWKVSIKVSTNLKQNSTQTLCFFQDRSMPNVSKNRQAHTRNVHIAESGSMTNSRGLMLLLLEQRSRSLPYIHAIASSSFRVNVCIQQPTHTQTPLPTHTYMHALTLARTHVRPYVLKNCTGVFFFLNISVHRNQ